MEARKRTRDQAWSIGSWADTVRDVSFNLSLSRSSNNENNNNNNNKTDGQTCIPYEIYHHGSLSLESYPIDAEWRM